VQRVVLITGTSRGLGFGLAQHYLRQGDVVCGCSRAPATITDRGYSHSELDVSEEGAVVAMVRSIARRHGRIDVLVNNAGIASMNHALLSTGETAKSIFATNFHGTFLFCREVAKTMVRKRSGRIVNFATTATPMRLEGESLYAASKAAVESFTQILARELGPTGVTVNAIGPTPIPTDLVRNVPKAKMDALLSRQAIRRFGTLNDVINVIDFYLAPGSKFITGQIIYLGGVVG
jgi:3-oxoacyl-[acyl-carrier protein] reductase